jgi:hypothetical protein
VGLPRRGIRAAYAARLISAELLRLEPSRILGTPRYQVIDASRVAAARSRLDAVTQSARAPADGAQSAGAPADLAPVALAGLASAIGLGDVLYRGRDGRAPRARMAQIAGSKSSRRSLRLRAAGCLLPGRPLTRRLGTRPAN